MKGIFFIEAPFQLIGAYEAIDTYKIKKYKIYIRLTRNNNIQLLNLVQLLFPSDKNINFLTINDQDHAVIDYLVVLKYLLFISIVHFRYDYVFLGNFNSKFLNLFTLSVPRKKIVLLDDGIKTILIQNKFTNKSNYNMFTMLYKIKPLNNQVIIYNNFDRFKSLMAGNKNIENNKIFFLGSKLPNIGLVSEDYYVYMIESILKKYENFNIVYIPHRAEDVESLSFLQRKYVNLQIKKMDYPVEIYMLENDILPHKIISFYSAALVSIKIMFPNLLVESIQLDPKIFEQYANIQLVYKNLPEYGIRVIDYEN